MHQTYPTKGDPSKLLQSGADYWWKESFLYKEIKRRKWECLYRFCVIETL